MDRHPMGFLVIPKEQIANIEDLPENLYLAVMRTARKIQIAQRKIYPDKFKMALQVEGLDVQHVHVKLFPIDTPKTFTNTHQRQSQITKN
jgi:diadenosine tetraphosphate (Ap4A) HIT family hydrolase